MDLNGVLGIASALVGVALVTTIVSHPNSSKVIGAIGSAFTGALKASQGN
jgi:hypothetical protein